MFWNLELSLSIWPLASHPRGPWAWSVIGVINFIRLGMWASLWGRAACVILCLLSLNFQSFILPWSPKEDAGGMEQYKHAFLLWQKCAMRPQHQSLAVWPLYMVLIIMKYQKFKLLLMPDKGPSIKYVTLFLANFYPPPPCHTLSHIPGPPQKKYVTHLGPPPQFLVGLVQKIRTKAHCTNSLSIVREGFCPGASVWKVLSGVVFVRTPFCHNTSVTTES